MDITNPLTRGSVNAAVRCALFAQELLSAAEEGKRARFYPLTQSERRVILDRAELNEVQAARWLGRAMRHLDHADGRA